MLALARTALPRGSSADAQPIHILCVDQGIPLEVMVKVGCGITVVLSFAFARAKRSSSNLSPCLGRDIAVMVAIFTVVSLAAAPKYSAQSIDFSNYFRGFHPKAATNPLIQAIVRSLISGSSISDEVLDWLPCDSPFLTRIQFYLHSTNPPGGSPGGPLGEWDPTDHHIRGSSKLCP